MCIRDRLCTQWYNIYITLESVMRALAIQPNSERIGVCKMRNRKEKLSTTPVRILTLNSLSETGKHTTGKAHSGEWKLLSGLKCQGYVFNYLSLRKN